MVVICRQLGVSNGDGRRVLERLHYCLYHPYCGSAYEGPRGQVGTFYTIHIYIIQKVYAEAVHPPHLILYVCLDIELIMLH